MSEAESKQIFQAKFNALLQDKAVTQKEIAHICGVSTSTVSTWSQGQNMPRMDKIEKLANYFGLPKSYFIEKDSPTPEPDRKITEEEIKAAFFEGSEDLPPEEMAALWDDAREYIQWKINQRRKKND